jgi:hypothetical protein
MCRGRRAHFGSGEQREGTDYRGGLINTAAGNDGDISHFGPLITLGESVVQLNIPNKCFPSGAVPGCPN